MPQSAVNPFVVEDTNLPMDFQFHSPVWRAFMRVREQLGIAIEEALPEREQGEQRRDPFEDLKA